MVSRISLCFGTAFKAGLLSRYRTALRLLQLKIEILPSCHEFDTCNLQWLTLRSSPRYGTQLHISSPLSRHARAERTFAFPLKTPASAPRPSTDGSSSVLSPISATLLITRKPYHLGDMPEALDVLRKVRHGVFHFDGEAEVEVSSLSRDPGWHSGRGMTVSKGFESVILMHKIYK